MATHSEPKDDLSFSHIVLANGFEGILAAVIMQALLGVEWEGVIQLTPIDRFHEHPKVENEDITHLIVCEGVDSGQGQAAAPICAGKQWRGLARLIVWS